MAVMNVGDNEFEMTDTGSLRMCQKPWKSLLNLATTGLMYMVSQKNTGVESPTNNFGKTAKK